VPCYNIEKYLAYSLRCLEQQWDGREDYEIILINDASKDRTIDKLNEFKSRYPGHVTVIDKKENKGVSAARNSGIDVARGEWVTFFDPDDLLFENGYARLLQLTEGANFDILRFGIMTGGEQTLSQSLVVSEPVKIDWQGNSLDYMVENSFGTCWSYLFKRNLLADHRFKPLSICEDTVFNLSILLENRPMARTLSQVYCYIYRKSSVSNTVDSVQLSKNCDDIFEAITILNGLKEGQREDVKQRISKHLETVFSPNLMTRLLLSDKSVSDIKKKVDALKKMSLFPLCSVPGGKVMTAIMNVIFSHPWLLSWFRPIYRKYRDHHI